MSNNLIKTVFYFQFCELLTPSLADIYVRAQWFYFILKWSDCIVYGTRKEISIIVNKYKNLRTRVVYLLCGYWLLL